MAKEKTGNVYKVTCAATGTVYTVRPDVWQKRLERFNVTSVVLEQNYLGREALKKIRESDDKDQTLKELQISHHVQIKTLVPEIWLNFISDKMKDVDDDIITTLNIEESHDECVIEPFEVVQIPN